MSTREQTWVSNAQQTITANNPPWLAERRRQALDRFIDMGLPTRYLEAWKYTRLDFLAQQPLQLTQPLCEPECVDDLPELSKPVSHHRVVFIDGFFSQKLSQLDRLPQAVHLADLATLLKTNPQAIQGYFDHEIELGEQPFWLLNEAFMQDGVVINIADNMVLSKPLELIFVSTPAAQSRSQQNRHLIVLGQRSQATIIEKHLTVGEVNSFISHASTIDIKDEAQLTFTKLNHEANTVTHLANTKLVQGRNSKVDLQVISLGGHVTRDRIDVVQNRENADFHAHGLYLPDQRQHMNFHINLAHQAALGHSNVLFKTVLADSASAVFNGKILVSQLGDQVEAHLKNNNLLLSDKCEINSKPVLEIYHDNVQCSHGATSGTLDQDMLFYLQSRGIGERDARRLLTLAFVEEILCRLPESVYDVSKTQVAVKLMQELEVLV